MVHHRHPAVSARIVHALNEHHPTFHLEGVRLSGAHLAAAGFEAPCWAALADGIRPHQIVVEVDREPGVPRHGSAPPLSQSTVCKWRAVSGHDSLPLNKRCSDLKEARCRVFRSRASRRPFCLGLKLPLSVCCFFGALLPVRPSPRCPWPPPCRLRRDWCWDVEGLHWGEQLLACVVKLERG